MAPQSLPGIIGIKVRSSGSIPSQLDLNPDRGKYPSAHTRAVAGRLPRTRSNLECHSQCKTTSSSKTIADPTDSGVSSTKVRMARRWLSSRVPGHQTQPRPLGRN
jgi:hypothetical protein